ncbi:hypothetical protein V2J09_012881 [Rumex salicifolius]
MYSHTADTARTIVGVVGNVLSFALFISPAPTFCRVIKNKSVEEFKFHPYVATILNCMLWIFYGLPVIHPHSTLIITINGVGLALEVAYMSIYFYYTDKKKRIHILLFILAELVFVGGLAAIAINLFHTHASRSNFVGGFCTFFGILMYASPLTAMWNVIKTKSVEYMPFFLSLAGFLNGICWTAYALIEFDLYVLIGNGVGAFLAAIQLTLYFMYRNSTPKKGENDQIEKPTHVELSTNV